MAILLDLLDPGFQRVKTFLVVYGKTQKHSRNALVEGPDNGSEGLLSCLN